MTLIGKAITPISPEARKPWSSHGFISTSTTPANENSSSKIPRSQTTRNSTPLLNFPITPTAKPTTKSHRSTPNLSNQPVRKQKKTNVKFDTASPGILTGFSTPSPWDGYYSNFLSFENWRPDDNENHVTDKFDITENVLFFNQFDSILSPAIPNFKSTEPNVEENDSGPETKMELNKYNLPTSSGVMEKNCSFNTISKSQETIVGTNDIMKSSQEIVAVENKSTNIRGSVKDTTISEVSTKLREYLNKKSQMLKSRSHLQNSKQSLLSLNVVTLLPNIIDLGAHNKPLDTTANSNSPKTSLQLNSKSLGNSECSVITLQEKSPLPPNKQTSNLSETSTDEIKMKKFSKNTKKSEKSLGSLTLSSTKLPVIEPNLEINPESEQQAQQQHTRLRTPKSAKRKFVVIPAPTNEFSQRPIPPPKPSTEQILKNLMESLIPRKNSIFNFNMLLREENQYARYIHANTSLLDLNADVQIPSSNADVDISTKAKKNIASKSISKKYWVCESIPPNTQPESQNPLSFDHLEIPKYKTIIPPISSTTAAENRAKTSEPGQIDKNISRKLISRELQSASKQPRVETGFKSSIRKKSSRRRRKEAERILACVTRLHSAIKRLPSPKKPVVLSNLNLCTFTNIKKLSKANEKIDGCEKSTYESILEMSGGTETKTQNAKALEQASDNVNETVFSKAQNTVQKIRSHVQPLETQKISIYESASPTIIPLKTNFVHSADEKLLIEFTTTPPSKDPHNECDSNGMKEVCEIIDQNLKDHIIDKQTQRESTSAPTNLSLNGLQVQSIVKSSKLDRSNAYRKRIHGIHRRYGRLRRRVSLELNSR